MTCVVAVKHKGRITMGGDSAGVSGLDVIIRRDPKVFQNGQFLMGYTGSFRMGQILLFKFVPPPIPKKQDTFEYMCTSFVDALRRTLKKGGFAKVDSNVEKGGTFLVGVRNRIFNVQADFHVGEALDDYDAIGCGEPYALGALSSQAAGMDPKARVAQALTAAEKFSGGVRGPFLILSTPVTTPTSNPKWRGGIPV